MKQDRTDYFKFNYLLEGTDQSELNFRGKFMLSRILPIKRPNSTVTNTPCDLSQLHHLLWFPLAIKYGVNCPS